MAALIQAHQSIRIDLLGQTPRQNVKKARELADRLRSVRGLIRWLIADSLTLADKRDWALRVFSGTRPLRLCVTVAVGLFLVACTDTEAAPDPNPSPIGQTAPSVALAPTPPTFTGVVVPRAPTRSPGSIDAERQRTAFFIQEQLRAVKAERAAEARRQMEAQLRRELVRREVAHRPNGSKPASPRSNSGGRRSNRSSTTPARRHESPQSQPITAANCQVR